jgi:nitrous oxidase accessory protein
MPVILLKRLVIIVLSFMPLLADVSPLQVVIDQAQPGSRIELPAGKWRGNLTINKPLMLIGQGVSSIIEGEGNGTVITVHADHVTLSHLAVRHSGQQRYLLDAAIRIDRSADVRVEHCHISDALFGIFAQHSRDLILTRNRIRSLPRFAEDDRGDGIRLWGVQKSTITANDLQDTRDLSINRSRNILIRDNSVTRSRYGTLLYMSHDINITRNRITRNMVGVIAKGGSRLFIEHNALLDTHGATGTGILFTGGRDLFVRYNTIQGNTQAFYIDTSTAEKGMQRTIEYNRIVANRTAFHFHAAINNNIIRHNTVTDNLEDVELDIAPTKSYVNVIKENYWDQYQGFDRDHNGIGDTPYLIQRYRDALWQYDHHLRFFYATPLLGFIHFLEKLAPFSEPIILFRDTAPLQRVPST